MAFWLPMAAWSGFIQYASVKTVVEISPSTLPHADKWLHAAAYGLLALLVAWPLRRHLRWAPGKAAMAAFLWATAFGGAEEIIQGFAERTPDWLDFLANAVGAAIAAGAAWGLERGRAGT